MKLITKIEITHFRSFLGNRKWEEAEINKITDVNIFSWGNDSGKSNIIRAMNLFFNGTTNGINPFNFENDFNKLKENWTHKVISIKIYFQVNDRNFSITKFYDRNGYRNYEYRFIDNDGEEIIIDERYEKNKERYETNKERNWEGSQKKKTVADKKKDEIFDKEKTFRQYASRFLGSINFSYVPAIREERFFSSLYGKIIYQIKQNEKRELQQLLIEEKQIENYTKTIKNKTIKDDFKKNLENKEWRQNRMKEIQKLKSKPILWWAINKLEQDINNISKSLFSSVNFLQSEFKVGNNLLNFFENFDIGTGIDKNISLKLRWDWLQAKFIPEMLYFLDSISQWKKYHIWWIEEPENSAEYKNQKEFVKKIKDTLSKDKQLFVTTHSEEFLALYNETSENTNLYFVQKENYEWKENNGEFSKIILYKREEELNSEIILWESVLRAKYAEELKKQNDNFLANKRKEEEEIEKLKNQNNQFKKELERIKPKKIFICEDKNWKKIWEHLFQEYGIEVDSILSSEWCQKFDWEIHFLKLQETDLNYKPMIFRENDRDGIPDSLIKELENRINNKYSKLNYKLEHLPVNEMENFYIITDPYFSDDLLKQNFKNLEITFQWTAEPKFNTISNLLWLKKDNKCTETTRWKQEAEEDIRKSFPWKDIWKLKDNLNIEKEILK